MAYLAIFISAMILMSVPIVLFGWDTFGWNVKIQKFQFRGPFDGELIDANSFRQKEWNSNLLILYYLKFRLLRVVQVFSVLVFVVYIFAYFTFGDVLLSKDFSFAQALSSEPESTPPALKVILATAALSYVLAVFSKALASHIVSEMNFIKTGEASLLSVEPLS